MSIGLILPSYPRYLWITEQWMFLTVPATKVLQTLETKIQKQVLKLKILKSFWIEGFFQWFLPTNKIRKITEDSAIFGQAIDRHLQRVELWFPCSFNLRLLEREREREREREALVCGLIWSGNTHRKGRISTIDHLVLTSLD